MNKEAIILMLTKSPKLKQVARNIAGARGLHDDLYQQLFLTLCEFNEKKLIKANDEGYLEFMCIRIMANNYYQRNGRFYKDFIKSMEFGEELNFEIIDQPDEFDELVETLEQYEARIKPIENYLNQKMDQDNFYRLTLLSRWAKGESYREISAKTKISMRSVGHAVQTALKEIKESA